MKFIKRLINRLQRRFEARQAAREYWKNEGLVMQAYYGIHADCAATDQKAAYKRAVAELESRPAPLTLV